MGSRRHLCLVAGCGRRFATRVEADRHSRRSHFKCKCGYVGLSFNSHRAQAERGALLVPETAVAHDVVTWHAEKADA